MPFQSISVARFRETLRDLRLVVLADTCVACGNTRVGKLPLCAACRRGLTPAQPDELDLAAAPWPEISSVTGLWLMDRGSSARAVVHALKYRSMPHVGRHIGTRLASSGALPDLAEPFLVPVPLYRTRLRERGFNQAMMIAQGIAAARPDAVLIDALRRTRPSASQTSKGRSGRSAVDRHAFEMVSSAVAGRDIVLVDDVFTTGATAAAAAGVLLSSGARSVHVAVAGITPARRTGST